MVATLAVTIGVTVGLTLARVVTTRASVSHIFSRGGGMGTISHGVVNTNAAAIQVNTVEFLNASSSLFGG